MFFLFKQKTAYVMRISDWSSDVCSSDLLKAWGRSAPLPAKDPAHADPLPALRPARRRRVHLRRRRHERAPRSRLRHRRRLVRLRVLRSEEHTSELQSLLRISYAVFCLKKKKIPQSNTTQQ